MGLIINEKLIIFKDLFNFNEFVDRVNKITNPLHESYSYP
jgi:hypothetical protein